MLFGIIGWAVMGLIAGFAATRIVNLRGDDPGLSIGLAIFAGILGGTLYTWLSGSPVTNFNVWSLVCALATAIAAVTIWHFVRTRSAYATPTSRRSY